jgi:hypothetical protein
MKLKLFLGIICCIVLISNIAIVTTAGNTPSSSPRGVSKIQGTLTFKRAYIYLDKGTGFLGADLHVFDNGFAFGNIQWIMLATTDPGTLLVYPAGTTQQYTLQYPQTISAKHFVGFVHYYPDWPFCNKLQGIAFDVTLDNM